MPVELLPISERRSASLFSDILEALTDAELFEPVPRAIGNGTLSAWINPSDIAGTDGSSVTSFTESSQTARVLGTVSGTAPILRKTAGPNGMPILDHTGGAGGLHSATFGAPIPGGDLTYFAVIRNSSTADQVLMQGQSNGLPVFGIMPTTGHIYIGNKGVEFLAESTVPLGPGWSIVVLTFSAAMAATHLDIDDTALDVTVGSARSWFTDWGISYGENYAAGAFAGKMAEIGMYSSVLSGADISTLKDYLKAKYALPVIVSNPNLFSEVGGPSFAAAREDMVAFKPPGEVTLYPLRHFRQDTVPWSMAERTWAGVEFFPPMWFPLIAGTEGGFTYLLENDTAPGPTKNYIPPQLVGFGGLYLGDSIFINATQAEPTLMHETGHHVSFDLRVAVGLSEISYAPAVPNAVVDALAEEVLAASRMADAVNGTSAYASTNVVELAAESYKWLLLENEDPSQQIMGPYGTWTSGVRADQAFLMICNNDAELAARWRAELTRPEIWPAAPWPVHRTLNSQAQIDARRNTAMPGGVPIQNLESNEGPTLLLADATNGYRFPTEAIGTTLSTWIRSDRPIALPYVQANGLAVTAGSPTVEIRNTSAINGPPALYAKLLDGPSYQWRTTITFRMGELLAGDKTLWNAKHLAVDNIETEYAIIWNGATVSASMTRRTGSGGPVIDTTKVTSGNVLSTSERCTVQAVWGAQGSTIRLRYRAASAPSFAELESPAMPMGRAAVDFWYMPIPHAANGPTLSYCALAAVAVETIHDSTLGPMIWMDAEYA